GPIPLVAVALAPGFDGHLGGTGDIQAPGGVRADGIRLRRRACRGINAEAVHRRPRAAGARRARAHRPVVIVVAGDVDAAGRHGDSVGAVVHELVLRLIDRAEAPFAVGVDSFAHEPVVVVIAL